MNITTTEMSVLTGVIPGRHNILIVTPQHQPSIWKTQRTTSIQTKTRSRVAISFSCNATSNQLSTQHMQVARKAAQTIPHGGFVPYTLEKLGLTKMLALEATNSLLCRHLLNLCSRNLLSGSAVADAALHSDSTVSSDSHERQVLLTLH